MVVLTGWSYGGVVAWRGGRINGGGRISGVVVLTGWSHGGVVAWRGGRINGVVVLTGWSY